MFLRHIKNVGRTGTVDLVGGHLIRFVIIRLILLSSGLVIHRGSTNMIIKKYFWVIMRFCSVVLGYCADQFGGSR